MPFVPDTTEAPARGRFVPDTPAPTGPPRLGAAAIPTANEAAGRGYTPPVPQPERREPGFMDKILGGVQATLNTLATGLGGGAGMAYGGLEAIGENIGSLVSGNKPQLGVEAQAAKRAQQFTPELPQALQTETGREYTGAVGQALQEHGPALIGVGPELASLGKAMAPAKQALGDIGVVRTAGQLVPETVRTAAREAFSPTPTAAEAALARPELQGISSALEAGYKLTPKAAKGGRASRTAQSVAGSARLEKELSLHNSENTARLARQDVGLPDDVPATPEATASIRKEAGQDYAAVQDVGRFKNDAQYGADLDSIVKPYMEASKDFPELANNPIIKKVEGLRKDEVNTASAVEVVKDLRNEADKAFRAGDKRLGSAYRAAASAVDNSMDRALGKMAEKGDPSLAEAVDKYRAARVRIAKTYLLDEAMDGKPGEVNANAYARAAKKGAKLTGPAEQIANFAKQFGEEGLAQKAGKSGGTGPSYGDILLAALHGPFVGVPALIARPVTRAVLGSKWQQRRMAQRAESTLARNEAAPAGPPPEPGLTRGFEDVPQGGAPAAPAPLGDLTPEWQTAPGAAPAGAAEALPAEGLTPALGEQPPTTGPRAGLNERAGQQIPAVPGRPGLPDTLLAGPPAEAAATEGANAAMVTPGAIEARRRQGAAAVDRAAEAERAQPVPAGEATEITPQNVRPAPEVPEPLLPVGEATEIKPEVVKPAPEIPEHPEVAKVKDAILKKRAAEAEKQKAVDELRAAAAAETDPEVKAALLARAEKVAPAKEKGNATGEVSKQEGGQREHPPGDEGGQTAEAGGGNRPERAASGGKAKGEEALDLTLPKLDEAFLDQQLRVKVAAEPPPTSRGRRQARATLERGIADGTLDKDGASLALWALDRNPNLARGLRVEVAKPAEGQLAKGSYNSATEIVKLFQGADNPQTAVHEILHHSERMMPPAVQQGIRRAWERALKDEMAKVPEEQRQHFDDLRKAADGDKEAYDRVKAAITAGQFDGRANYHLVNPTEFWAVNGARIMHERFTGRGSWRAQAQQWLREMIEHVKGLAGVRSDSPILKALEEVLNPSKTTGTRKSPTMIKSAEPVATGASP